MRIAEESDIYYSAPIFLDPIDLPRFLNVLLLPLNSPLSCLGLMGLRIATGLLQRPQYIFPPCLHRIQGSRVPEPSRNAQKRYKHVQVSKRGKQIEQNELQWKEQAEEILAGRKESMLSMLEKRGYVNQVVGYASPKEGHCQMPPDSY